MLKFFPQEKDLKGTLEEIDGESGQRAEITEKEASTP